MALLVLVVVAGSAVLFLIPVQPGLAIEVPNRQTNPGKTCPYSCGPEHDARQTEDAG